MEDGGDVNGGNLGVGRSLGCCHGPVTCPRAEVEDALCVWRDPAEADLVVEQDEIDLIENCEASLLGVIAGHEVRVVAVPAAVFDDGLGGLGFD